MANSSPNGLGSLTISGFRGVDHLVIPRLGRVVLLAGKNGVGKTTILEALQLYADRGKSDSLQDILNGREELSTFRNEQGKSQDAPAVDRLFHAGGGDRPAIEIGPSTGARTLEIAEVERQNVPERMGRVFDTEDIRILRITFADACTFVPWARSSASPIGSFRALVSEGAAPEIRCESLGPAPLRGDQMARLWDSVVLTPDETLPLTLLRLVFGDRLERTAVIGDGTYESRRRVVVKLVDQADPVPLRSLGEGAVRIFGIALALANCRDGLLLIDEAENGIHYSLQYEFWGMVLRAAKAHNAQVVATTHSRDCINGFAAAALASRGTDANLVRIGRRNGKLRAVDYTTDELRTAAEQNIEVR